MFKPLLKEEMAHDGGIWCCAWARSSREREKEQANGDQEENNSRDSLNNVQTEKIVEDFIVTGSVENNQNNVKIWTPPEGEVGGKLKLKHQLSGHCFGVISLDVNADSSMIVSSSLDSTIRLWNVQEADLKMEIEASPLDVWTVAFSPDSRHIISGCQGGKVNVYSVDSGKIVSTLADTRGKFILSIAYSPDGKYIASGAVDGIINVFDVATGKLVRTLEGHAMPIRSLTFSPDSKLLLTASDDKHVKLYNVHHESDAVSTLSGHASWVASVAFSPDGTHFASGSSDTTVKIWELKTRSCVHTFKEHTDQVSQVKFSPDSDKILSVSEDNSIIIYSHKKETPMIDDIPQDVEMM